MIKQNITGLNWWEAASWLFTSMAADLIKLGTTKNNSSKWPAQNSNQGPLDCESNALTTWPCFLSERVARERMFLFSSSPPYEALLGSYICP